MKLIKNAGLEPLFRERCFEARRDEHRKLLRFRFMHGIGVAVGNSAHSLYPLIFILAAYALAGALPPFEDVFTFMYRGVALVGITGAPGVRIHSKWRTPRRR